MRYFMGVDGGGSKTTCLLSTDKGHILGRGHGGPSNYHVVGENMAQTALHTSITEALKNSSLPITTVESIYLGLAGVGRPHDHTIVERMISALPLTFGHCTIDHDAAVALAATTHAKAGVIIISGTGSMTFGINHRGQRARAGGWGPILGDEGGGYDIGCQALKVVMRAADGRGPVSALQSRVLNHFNLTHVEELVPLVYGSLERHDISALAPVVIKAAERADLEARRILLTAGRELALAATTVIEALQLERETFTLGLAGGVLRHKGILARTIKEKITEVAPFCTIAYPVFEPVVGALFLALRQAGVELSSDLISTIKNTL